MTVHIKGTANFTYVRPEDIPWYSKAVGEIFGLQVNAGAPVPPTNDPNFRYILLTYNNNYNTDVLINESVSGTAPLVVATAEINLPSSTMHGQTIHLINTEGRFIRARETSGLVQNDALQNITGDFSVGTTTGFAPTAPSSGAFIIPGEKHFANVASNQSGAGDSVKFDASRVARTDDETRPKNISAIFFMRIL